MTRSRYNALDELVGTLDAMGNVAAMVYDPFGRQVSQWAGVASSNDFATMALDGRAEPIAAGLKMVAKTVYDGYGEVATTYRVAPITDAPDSTDLANDYVSTTHDSAYIAAGGAATGRVVWAKPQSGGGPWSKQVYDDQGRMVEATTTQNGSETYVLAQSGSVYDAATGWLTASRVHEVTGGGALTGNYLETAYAYDAAGRQFKTLPPTGGGAISVMVYDPHGRVQRTLSVSDGAGTAAVTDDAVLTETLYGYDNADQVITVESLTRTPTATATGLLSGAAADQRRPRYTATWYDQAARGPVPPTDEAPVPPPRTHLLRPTLAGRDHLLHDQTQPRPRPPRPLLPQPVP